MVNSSIFYKINYTIFRGIFGQKPQKRAQIDKKDEVE